MCSALPQKRESPGIRGFQLVTWCGRRDSNSHTLRRQNLNLVCLPISPRPQTLQTKTPGSAWRFGIWGGRWGSNPRPQEPQSCALPTELRPPYCIACARDQMNGAPGRIRTCDHPLRRRMLYPTELRALLAAFHSERRLQAPAIEQPLQKPSYPAAGCARQAGRML